ncbi:glycerophosphodiester phosphodiesterase [soil metagenome]
MLIYGHRGSAATHPENTLASFQAAIATGCHGIELDVWYSADRVPVVIHDRSLVRTTTGSGNVDETLLSELQALDTGEGEPVPTLAQVLSLVPGSMYLDIEVKGQNGEDGLLEVLGERSRSSWAISSFDWTVLRKLRERSAEIDLWVLTDVVTDDAIREAAVLGATTLAVDHQYYDPKAAAKVAQTRLRVMTYTVNQADECRRLRDLGVHAVCTDDPVRILESLR